MVQNEWLVYFQKETIPYFYIEHDQWARLNEYWSNPETYQKAMKMSNARKQVKSWSNEGTARKIGKEVELVSFLFSNWRMCHLCVFFHFQSHFF